jgi:magnesium-transporting ATPase (P-type)
MRLGVHLSESSCSTYGSRLSHYSVFEYTYLLWWNSFWTIAPVIAIGIFDRIVGTSSDSDVRVLY